MTSAATKLKEALKGIVINPSAIRVVANVNGLPYENPQATCDNLVRQITASVQWVASIEYMMGQGINEFIEIGPGKVLKGLIRRINSTARVHNIEKPADIDSLDI